MSKTFRGESLVGKQFGSLIVLNFVPNEKHHAHWNCKCLLCNNEKVFDGQNLKRTKSCGCNRTPGKDLTNKRFGKLVALNSTEERKDQKVVWNCICDCGNYHKVTSAHLLAGNTQSCGCNLRSDISGRKFYKLTAIKCLDERDKENRILWLCKCDCGNEVKYSVKKLMSGNVKSCGCLVSTGEYTIIQLLIENNIQFKRSISFKDLRSKKNYPLQFDFGIYKDKKLK